MLRWLGRACSNLRVNQEVPEISGIRVTAKEYQDALKFLIYFDQSRRLNIRKGTQLVTRKVTVKLLNINLEYEIVVLHGRVKNFPIGFSSNKEIPVLSCSKLAELIVKYHHYRMHRDIDTVVSVVQHEFWPIKVRKLAAKVESTCLDCKMIRARPEGQV